jgi:oligopeptide/dipeptide ABC transporter ATP-binding protein
MMEVLTVKELKREFDVEGIRVFALNGISFTVNAGDAVGLVGESGCGKTTAARCILRLLEPSGGTVYFKGTAISSLPEKSFRPLRQKLQMVFQDATTSLNPRMTVRQTVGEPLRLFDLARGVALEERVLEMLTLVNLERALLDRYPHQLSGGQQQRVAIARAFITRPECIVLDEPTASQDASVKIQLMALLRDLQEKLGMAYVFISHDLSTVKSLCGRILVMYLGKIVEGGSVGEIFTHPLHPYTRALLSAVPIPDPKIKRQRVRLKGETRGLTRSAEACSMQERCPNATSLCRDQDPPLRRVGEDHEVACHLV